MITADTVEEQVARVPVAAAPPEEPEDEAESSPAAELSLISALSYAKVNGKIDFSVYR
ncbi:MAG: hypothetical protein OXD50_03045 [Chloroflexi bacterium]|nr:hypothetical protein [Chloroflexota bacterium]